MDGQRIERVAVVGAGLAGLVCARELARRGVEVVVVDKGRGAGGRLATRRRGGPAFDHGAQYFTARGPRFADQVESWIADGTAARWEPRLVALDRGRVRAVEASSATGDAQPEGATRYVGTPGMRQLALSLTEALVQLGAPAPRQGLRVERLAPATSGWRLHTTALDEAGADTSPVLGPFDAVVVATPAPQAADLLASAGEPWAELERRVRRVRMTPCLAVLVEFEEALCTQDGVPFDGAFVGPRDGVSARSEAGHGSSSGAHADRALSWVARDGSKPGRVDPGAWVLHASPDFSAEHFDAPAAEWSGRLLEEFARELGGALPGHSHLDTHRWGFALAPAALLDGALGGSAASAGIAPLVVAGDWCAGSRVEGAFDSGLAAAALLE